jgi:hypothetical protein
MRALLQRFRRLTAFRAITLVFLPIAAVDGCSDSGVTLPPAPALATVAVSLELASIEVGQMIAASASGFDEDGASIETGRLTWSSDDPGVAGVSQTGDILAISAGTTRIVARSEVGVTGGRTITVAALPAIRINEVQPRGDARDGWIELVNLMASAADISGWMLFGRDFLGQQFTFPSGTTIPAGGYLVVEETSLPFGVGSVDTANLFSRFGVHVDGTDWVALPPAIHARCPDGSAAFTNSAAPTKGRSNACPVGR